MSFMEYEYIYFISFNIPFVFGTQLSGLMCFTQQELNNAWRPPIAHDVKIPIGIHVLLTSTSVKQSDK